MANRFTTGSHELVLKRIRDIPSLPEVVNRIIELLGDANTPAAEIARLISYDPGLTSKVLRMVNSAAFGFQRQITSIQHGIMILGFNTARGLVLSASILKMFSAQEQASGVVGLDHREFWEHSMATAVAARIVADTLRLPGMDDAFSAGMLHDIGKIVLDVYFKQEYAPVLKEARAQRMRCHGRDFIRLEQKMLGINHAQIGSSLASKWKLPVTILEVIEHHHHPDRATMAPQLVYLIALANELAVIQLENYGVLSPMHMQSEVVAYFGLSMDEMRLILEKLSEEMGSVEEMLAIVS